MVAVSREPDFKNLSRLAWTVRENSFIIGATRVGCAILADDGSIHVGCNVEHRYRCHDVHAEVNAITSMISAGKRAIKAMLIAAERDKFTPCGGCMDWIMQFAADDCVIAIQNRRDAAPIVFTPEQLMPHYPR
jgi:cytidine deaminase